MIVFCGRRDLARTQGKDLALDPSQHEMTWPERITETIDAACSLSREDNPKVSELAAALGTFYSSTRDYTDFLQTSWKPEFWAPVVANLQSRLRDTRTCRVLEFGAGRTQFGKYLAELRRSVTFEVQDITCTNESYLREVSDGCHIGPLTTLAGPYDVIFSTFVWEHITNPKQTLAHLVKILSPAGSLFIACPRYDLPFHVSPSAKHLPRAERLVVGGWLALRRLAVLMGAEPAFLIHLRPAVRASKWFRDADAVHWVSYWDFLRTPGIRVRRLRIPVDGFRASFWEKVLLLFVEITKAENPRSRNCH